VRGTREVVIHYAGFHHCPSVRGSEVLIFVSGLAGSFSPAATVIQSDGPLREKRTWRGAGVAVPVFSLRSQSSVGAGEFVDIRPLVDLCAATGHPIPPSILTIVLHDRCASGWLFATSAIQKKSSQNFSDIGLCSTCIPPLHSLTITTAIPDQDYCRASFDILNDCNRCVTLPKDYYWLAVSSSTKMQGIAWQKSLCHLPKKT
jgi:hypothetical protein